MWVNKNIRVILCNDDDSEVSKYCGRTEWIATIEYERGKRIFENTTWGYMGEDKWHTFNQTDAEKFTLGDFQGRE